MILLEKYIYGSCHLFSIVAAELLQNNNAKILLLWDVNPIDEFANQSHKKRLIHACVEVKNGFYDAYGLNPSINYKNFIKHNEIKKEYVSINKMKSLIVSESWFNFDHGEYEKLQSHIKHQLDQLNETNINKYNLAKRKEASKYSSQGNPIKTHIFL